MKNFDKKFITNERILKPTAGGLCNPSVTPRRGVLWYASCVRSESRPVCRGLSSQSSPSVFGQRDHFVSHDDDVIKAYDRVWSVVTSVLMCRRQVTANCSAIVPL